MSNRYAFLEVPLPNAILLPMFPKQTQLQNRTLAIQVTTAIVSSVIKMSLPSFCDNSVARLDLVDSVVGGGTNDGLIKKRARVPKIPTAADRTKPV